jgi:hypothetical protein
MPQQAAITSPMPGSHLGSSGSVTFHWDPGKGVPQTWPAVGTSHARSADLYDAGTYNGTQATVSGITTNGTWQFAQYTPVHLRGRAVARAPRTRSGRSWPSLSYIAAPHRKLPPAVHCTDPAGCQRATSGHQSTGAPGCPCRRGYAHPDACQETHTAFCNSVTIP